MRKLQVPVPVEGGFKIGPSPPAPMEWREWIHLTSLIDFHQAGYYVSCMTLIAGSLVCLSSSSLPIPFALCVAFFSQTVAQEQKQFSLSRPPIFNELDWEFFF